MRGSYTRNDQQTGRELLTPDEVRMLDNRYALLFIRGERPVKDFKYDILKHPNIKLTEDGQGKSYMHGDTSGAAFTINITEHSLPPADTKTAETGYILLSEDDVEKLFAENSEPVQIMC